MKMAQHETQRISTDIEELEVSLIRSLRSLLQDNQCIASNDQGIDDATLRRFLRARSLNVEKAYKFLLRHLQWKSEFMPEGFIRSSEVQNELKKEKIYLQGVDKRGRPIGVILANKHRSSERDLEEFKRYVVYGFEKAVSSLPVGEEKFVMIADLKGWTYRNIDLKGYLSLLEIMQDHYPERLGKFFLVHVPSLFMGVYKMVYPFIDPVVKEKIVFVDDKHLKSTLLKDIDESQLPDIFGGDLPLKPIT